MSIERSSGKIGFNSFVDFVSEQSGRRGQVCRKGKELGKEKSPLARREEGVRGRRGRIRTALACFAFSTQNFASGRDLLSLALSS